MRMSQPSRRRLVHLALTAALVSAACLVWPSTIHAQEPYEVFFPLLVDLPGWKGDKPQGLTITAAGMFSARRDYQRGDARLYVSVGAAKSKLTAPAPALTFQAGDYRISISIMDGLQVGRTFDVKSKWGGVSVALAPNASFSLTFNDGVTEDEALTLAQQFDWRALQAAVPPM
jgi:hypothetical protein